MLDLLLVVILVLVALIYLGFRFRSLVQAKSGSGACGGCSGACKEDQPGQSGGIAV